MASVYLQKDNTRHIWIITYLQNGRLVRESSRTANRQKALRRAWQKACRAAGTPGKLPHDFRRTARSR